VIGGGIGGLSAARSLQRAGWQVQVLEQASRLEPLGAGITLWPNAVLALRSLGITLDHPTVEATSGGLRTSRGRWLSRTDPSGYADRYGAPLVALHRADLQDALLNSLAPGTVLTSARVDQVELGADRVVVQHASGASHADLVVLADGLASTHRSLVAGPGPGPRYAGYTAWRAVSDHPTDLTGQLGTTESWGRGQRFGIVPLLDGRTYWFATANTAEGERSADGEHAEVVRRFAGWHAPIHDLLNSTDPAAVLRHDVYDLRPHPTTYVRGPLVLLGDAAHAMTPNLGQGACQAIEDAVTLGALAHPSADLAAALARYDAVRRPRAQRIARISREIGLLGQLEGRQTVAARNLAMWAAPNALAERQLDPTLNWQPP
jgi:2-polyprenyl-6-methoxyphenol hydroxylase-like FAD-dependent oxidoreductase